MRKANRWLTGTAALGAVASMLIAAPAQASDETCGAWKNVRSSINYRACTITKNGKLKAEGYFRNDHGSSVAILWRSGYSYQGGPVKDAILEIGSNIPTGDSTTSVPKPQCGESSRLVVSVYDDSLGYWGYWSYDAERYWPC